MHGVCHLRNAPFFSRISRKPVQASDYSLAIYEVLKNTTNET